MKRATYYQSGQILLIAVLTLAVAGTIALSLVARSTTDTKISSQVEESSRAFSAAEAGIEEALKTGVGGSLTLEGSNATADTTVTTFGAGVGPFTIPRTLSRDTGDTLFLVPHNASGEMVMTPYYQAPTLTICFSKEGGSTPALALSLWYKDGASYQVKTLAFDPDPGRRAGNSFSPVGGLVSGCGKASVYRTTLAFAALGINPSVQTLLFARIRPLFADATVSVDASAPLPIQGSRIEATGVAGGTTTRRVLVYQQYPTLPLLADYVLFSLGDLSHE